MVAESNQTGQITRRFHYKPFGETIETQQDDVGYTGHKHDADLGLTYMQARYYDPVLGRFYGNDPVGFAGTVDTFNRYSYVGNNPLIYSDPTGMVKISFGFEAQIVLIAGAKISAGVYVDTETLEVGGSVSGGPRVGVEAAVSATVSVSESSESPAKTEVSSSATVDASASLGAVGISKDILSDSGSKNGSTEGVSGSGSVDAVKVKPSLGGGASVGANFTAKGSSDLLKKAVDVVKKGMGESEASAAKSADAVRSVCQNYKSLAC